MFSDDKDVINAKRKDKWIEVIFNIEAMAVKPETVETALKEHIEKLENVPDAVVFGKEFSKIADVENPPKKVEKAYSMTVEVKMLIKNMIGLMSIVTLYGPSSIEIIGPNPKEIRIDEMQNIANSLAGLIHQFAQAGAGGIVMTPEK